jgi:hypothetical protein
LCRIISACLLLAKINPTKLVYKYNDRTSPNIGSFC